MGRIPKVPIPGLQQAVDVTLDRDGVLHLTAKNDLDLARAQGYTQARDRFFQMDVLRREISGDLAELLGPGELGSDVQFRTIGLRRAAERSVPVLSAETVAILQAYADGVNAWLAEGNLPIEYSELELTSARPWDIVDTVVLAKGLAANLSLDIDIGPTLDLVAYLTAGALGGFDGEALFFEDVRRAAPIDPASTVPDAGGGGLFAANAPKTKWDRAALAKLGERAKRVKEKFGDNRLMKAAAKRREFQIGSNEWGIGAENSVTGRPIMANDPHLSLNAPATFYELRLEVKGGPPSERLNVSGVTFPGFPGIVLGQNEDVTWGATTNGLDVSDVFQDDLYVGLPQCLAVGSLACILSDGQFRPVNIQQGVVYLFNSIGDGIDDNLVDPGLPPEQTTIATVPFRSFGPILDIDDPSVLVTGGVTTALVLQYTGFHPTREIETFLGWNRAKDLDDFTEALEDFDVGAQNFSYADMDGNLAYFSSAEAPLRTDLETGPIDRKDGPVFIRDGSGAENWVPDPAQSQGQAIPFAILPNEERARLINPPFFVNANNDPAGTTLDNDPLNQFRVSDPGAVYYLAPGYANGLRAGRITRLIQDELDQGKKLSARDMKRFQANTQQLDAELLTPFLLDAYAAASSPGAPPELESLGDDARIAEAIGRLTSWDFSTPTGIPEGWDASDPRGHRLPHPPASEETASVAATIYNVWRAKAIKRVVDTTLSSVGVGAGSGDALKALYNLLTSDPFTGVGASGVNFFPTPAGLSAEQRRDATLLAALGDALDALASNDYAAAFGNSTDQDDYRWGKLHRITFDAEFNPDYSIPPAAGFEDLAPGLPGLSRDGGYEIVNASGFSARADGVNSFRFGSGPVRRYVGIGGYPGWHFGRIFGFNVIPGGSSGDPNSPLYATQLPTWLTADYHYVIMSGLLANKHAISREKLVPEH